MNLTEPINLREWKPRSVSAQRGRLFTCGRPGRATYGRAKAAVGEEIIDQWAGGLPKADVLHIVSLLGRKTTGLSEFSYYPFRSSKEAGTKPIFEEWLNRRYAQPFLVHEFPTVDGRGISPDVLNDAKRQLLSLLDDGHTTVVIDSAGAERTARVCEAIGCPSEAEAWEAVAAATAVQGGRRPPSWGAPEAPWSAAAKLPP